MGASPQSVAYLGPAGTFTEEALRSVDDYRSARVERRGSIVEVLEAVGSGDVELGFVPIENAIDGTVNATLDALLFDVELLIQREVVMDIHLHLMAPPGTSVDEIRQVASIPVALAQCDHFLRRRLGDVALSATNSTAEAAQSLAEHPDRHSAAIAPRLAAELYGLEILVEDVEDHPDNQTRFVSVARHGIPPATGHDRTSIVCFQHADRPGNLHGILGQFVARSINLTKLESRPTKRSLGEYCFVIDLDGHLADEVVGDCLRDLHAGLAEVKFLGSYPAAGRHGPARRRRADDAWKAAEAWLEELRGEIG